MIHTRRLDEQDKRLDQLAVEHAKTMAKVTAAGTVFLAILNLALKYLG